jgi:hypothetical protein
MAEPKTKKNTASVKGFLDAISDKQQRTDSIAIVELMQVATKEEPKMWGTSIIGFGSYHYKYDSGREGDAPLLGFSPRKANLTFYLGLGSGDRSKLLGTIGKHKTGKGCLYINKLEDIDVKVLKQLVQESIRDMRKNHSN